MLVVSLIMNSLFVTKNESSGNVFKYKQVDEHNSVVLIN